MCRSGIISWIPSVEVGVSAIRKTTAKAAVRLPSLRDRCHCAAAPLTKGNSINPIGDFNTY